MSRRTAVLAAGWSVPTLVVGGRAPAFAGSGVALCPEVAPFGGVWVDLVFSGLDAQGRWQPGASGQVLAKVGRRVGEPGVSSDQPGLGFQAASDGLTVSVSAAAVGLQMDYWVSTWSSVPTGWGTPASGTGQFFFVPQTQPNSVVPPTTAPGLTGAGVVDRGK